MDWIAIAVSAIMGGLGAALGVLIARPFNNKTLRTVLGVGMFVLATALGRVYVAPWVMIEYAFRSSPELQSLAALVPDHVEELKAAMREAYRKGGKPADFERAGYEWGRRYTTGPIFTLMSSRNDALVIDSFTRYLSVFKAVEAHDKVKCFAWIEGTGGALTQRELGIGPPQSAMLTKLLADTALLSKPENAPLAGQKVPDGVEDEVIANVRKNWDAAEIDFEATAEPSAAMPDATKAKVCYTSFAIASEIQALPARERAAYLRAMYGGKD